MISYGTPLERDERALIWTLLPPEWIFGIACETSLASLFAGAGCCCNTIAALKSWVPRHYGGMGCIGRGLDQESDGTRFNNVPFQSVQN